MITWRDENHLDVDGVGLLVLSLADMARIRPGPGELVLLKPAWMVRRYMRLLKRLQPKRIFELGIWQGGSAVLLQRVAAAQKLVAIDLSNKRVAALDDYIERFALQDVLRPYFGVNQADDEQLRKLLRTEFGDEPLDLVVDDASHLLDETRRSFNTLFPRLRPGGAYVIEDWPWAHAQVDDFPDDTRGLYSDSEPMTKLIFELVLACASTTGLIKSIEIDRNSATIWRGPAPIKRRGFDVARLCAARGRGLIAPGPG